METLDHRELKALALAFMERLGCVAMATEVACPIARFRVDAAGWCELGDAPFARRDTRSAAATLWSGAARADGGAAAARGFRAGRTVIVECKQSRADFFRDRSQVEPLVQERERLLQRRAELEETLVKRHEPQLRVGGTSLFAECEEWRFEESRMAAYRRVLVSLKRVDDALHGQTKFCLLARYRLADRLYVAAPAGMLRPKEVPPGWGLLECSRRRLRTGAARPGELDDLPVHEVLAAPAMGSPEHRRMRLLRNLAVAASRGRRSARERSGETADSADTLSQGPGSSVG
ncbi:MAG: hypothetical protein U0574_00795 [Phycisphaerales bacterium]